MHEEMCDFLPAQVCSIQLPFTRPTNNVLEQVVAFRIGHESETQLATFWVTLKAWMSNINRKGFRATVRREKDSKKNIICKLVHKHWTTMYMMKHNGLSNTNICLMCIQEVETWEHAFKCKCEDVTTKKIINLIFYNNKTKTLPYASCVA